MNFRTIFIIPFALWYYTRERHVWFWNWVNAERRHVPHKGKACFVLKLSPRGKTPCTTQGKGMFGSETESRGKTPCTTQGKGMFGSETESTLKDAMYHTRGRHVLFWNWVHAERRHVPHKERHVWFWNWVNAERRHVPHKGKACFVLKLSPRGKTPCTTQGKGMFGSETESTLKDAM